MFCDSLFLALSPFAIIVTPAVMRCSSARIFGRDSVDWAGHLLATDDRYAIHLLRGMSMKTTMTAIAAAGIAGAIIGAAIARSTYPA
jgi:hypothetical protein